MALTKYRQAYELSKDPRLLFNMAICEKNLRGYARMQSLLQQYRREAGSSISPDDRATVEGVLAATKNLVGAVRLATSEGGASVAVDGEPAGTTPLAQPLVIDLGKHVVVVKKDGFETFERAVEVPGGGEVTVNVTLVPQIHASHLVVATEADATIVIDNAVAGTGRFDGKLSPGTHDVRVTEPGKTPYKAEIELKDGEMRTVQVTLADERHGGALWPWLVGGAAVAAGAAVGGYFLFKPRDETASVPPGKLGAAQFSLQVGR